MNTGRSRLLFYVTHLFGVGHYVRSLALVRALDTLFDITLVLGGVSLPGLRQLPRRTTVVQLPALTMSAESSVLFSAAGEEATLDLLRRRQELLVALVHNVRPHVVVTESFPLGRAKLRYEIEGMLEAAQRVGAMIVASHRDIYVSRAPGDDYNRVVRELLDAYYDLLLIHGDPSFIHRDFSATGILNTSVDTRLTGYVVSSTERAERRGAAFWEEDRPLIVVSAGGGRTGYDLLLNTISASSQLSQRFPHSLLLTAGPLAPRGIRLELQGRCSRLSHCSYFGEIPDLHRVLRKAALSVSLGGYNTVIEGLNAGTRMLIYPFQHRANEDQELRAQMFAEAGLLSVIRPDEVDPLILERRMEMILSCPSPVIPLNFNGAENSVHEIVCRL